MERLNFNHLFYFYIVAKEGSIKGAAEKLYVSQPTISDQIKLLEIFLQTPLFDRRNRRLSLNSSGKSALVFAEKVFDEAADFTRQLRQKDKAPKKSIDIGITHFSSQYLNSDFLLPLFTQDQMKVCVMEDERHLLLAELEEDNLDMVISNQKDPLANNLKYFRIGTNRSYAIAHTRMKIDKKRFPETLDGHCYCAFGKESHFKYEINLFFSKYQIHPKVIGECDDLELLQKLVEEAAAFVIVPETAMKRICRHPQIVVLGELKELQTDVFAIMKKSYEGPAYKLARDKA